MSLNREFEFLIWKERGRGETEIQRYREIERNRNKET
jgi:hypothetical protein